MGVGRGTRGLSLTLLLVAAVMVSAVIAAVFGDVAFATSLMAGGLGLGAVLAAVRLQALDTSQRRSFDEVGELKRMIATAGATQDDRLDKVAREMRGALDVNARASAVSLQTDALEGVRTRLDAIGSDVQDLTNRVHRLRSLVNNGQKSTRALFEQSPQAVAQYIAMREELGVRKVAMPSTGGWALNASTVTELVARILAHPTPPTVLELGSGVSTVWSSLAIQRRGGGRIVSLEHQREYLDQTNRIVHSDGAPEFVELLFAPLVRDAEFDEPSEWYDLSNLPSALEVDLLVVDGPPGQPGAFNRFPALPRLAHLLSPGAVILVDDTSRPEEREMIERWATMTGQIELERELPRATLLRWVGSRQSEPTGD